MNKDRGFSLVEVVVAIGVFVVGVVGAIALLSSTTNSASSTLDANGALRVAESSEALLRANSWDFVLNYLGETDSASIYADKSGSRIGFTDTVELADAYYEIDLRRMSDLSPITEDTTAGFLAFEVRVSWPVRQGSGETVPIANRDSVTLNMAINR